ncbi:FGGY-family carbohydrate kinase [Herbiconiux sp. L3-i23]|uniref:FGGY-family carbohydrate kinase n=1 Tax=Herbiconiux sp. L3-i23 TaxID=2905871 RepID=UPI00204A0C09|nr:FGGY-family carbohydrate kinase [Herbiconiux sp. L3-i23]BDI22563.1 gluconate kinase [Herbiconiux sp. L3-i23]
MTLSGSSHGRSSRSSILALDIGSSSFRAAIYDSDLVVRQHDQVHYEFRSGRSPAGSFPAEPLRDLIVASLSRLDLRSVATVSVSSLWHSLLAVDEHDRPLTEVFTWESSGPDATLDGLFDRFAPEEYRASTGSYLHSSYPLAAYWYLRGTVPSSARWIDLSGWLMRQVFGVDTGWSVDLAAGSGIWNQDRAEWDATVLDAVDLDASALGPVWREPVSLVGDAASALDLSGAVLLPVFGDGVCNSVGIGAVGPTVSALTAGTSGSLRMLLGAEDVSVPRGLWRYRLRGGDVAIGGAVSNAGNLIEWLRTSLGVADPLAFGASAPPAFDGLLATPNLAGERGPGYRRDASGSLTGLRSHHTRDDIAQAFVLSALGVYRELTDLVAQTKPQLSSLIASGGVVTGSPIFAQLLADATARPVSVSTEAESSLFGAALLAAGRPAPVISGQVFDPRPDWVNAIAIRTPAAR